MGSFDEFRKNVEKKIKKCTKEEEIKKKAEYGARRCPRCFSMRLEYDHRTGKILCAECGFETYIKNIKER